MAKIYETKEDYQRDQLTEQAHQTRRMADTHSQVGWSMFAGSVILDTIQMARKNASKFLRVANIALIVGTLIEFLQSWRTNSKARDLERQKEKLGPETVVLPPEVVAEQKQKEAEPEPVCTACLIKQYANPPHHKTMLEMVEKSAVSVDRTVH